jgi:hypothetical protein
VLEPFDSQTQLIQDLQIDGQGPPKSQVSRMLQGDGKEITGWLSPSHPLGTRFLQLREVSRADAIGWLTARLHPTETKRLSKDILEFLPLKTRDKTFGTPPPSDPLAYAVRQLHPVATHEDTPNEQTSLAPIQWQDLLSWADILHERNLIDGKQYAQATANLSALEGPLPLSGDDPALLIGLLSDALSDDFSADSRTLRLRGAAALLTDAEEDVQDALLTIEKALPSWVALAGSWDAPLDSNTIRELFTSDKHRAADPELIWRIAEAGRDDDPKRREERIRDCLREVHGQELQHLLDCGIVEKSDRGLHLSTTALRYAHQSAAFHLAAKDAPKLSVHPDGQLLVSDAVALAPEADLQAWCDIALQDSQPFTAFAVLDGLAARQTNHSSLTRLWAASMWMYLYGYGSHGPARHGFYEAGLSSVQDAGRALRKHLPILRASDPLAHLKELVPPTIRERCDDWLGKEPPQLPDVEANLTWAAPFQVPFSAWDDRGTSFLQPQDELWLFHAHNGDSTAQQKVLQHNLLKDLEPAALLWAQQLCADSRLPEGHLEHRVIEALELAMSDDADADAWRAGVLDVLRAQPSALPDANLCRAGILMPTHGGYRQEDLAVGAAGEPPPHPTRLEQVLQSRPAAFIVKLAADLGRNAVLRAWIAPEESAVTYAVAAATNEDSCVVFSRLEHLSELRHHALIALGDRNPLRADRWSVRSPVVEFVREASAALTDLDHTWFQGTLSDVHWFPLVRALLTPWQYHDDDPTQPITLETDWVNDALQRCRNHPRNPGVEAYIALLTTPEQFRPVVLLPFLNSLWRMRTDLRVSAVLTELAPDWPDADLWQEDPSWHNARIRHLLLHNDRTTQNEWLKERWLAETSDGWPRVNELQEDLELADALWGSLGTRARTVLLGQLIHHEGALDSTWIRRGREYLAPHRFVELCQKRGTKTQLANALKRELDNAEAPRKRMFLRLRKGATPLTCEHVDEALDILEASFDDADAVGPDTLVNLEVILRGHTAEWLSAQTERLRDLAVRALATKTSWEAEHQLLYHDVQTLLQPRWINDEALCAALDAIASQVIPNRTWPPLQTTEQAYGTWLKEPSDLLAQVALNRAEPAKRQVLVDRALKSENLTTYHWTSLARLCEGLDSASMAAALHRLRETCTTRERQGLLHDCAYAPHTSEYARQLRLALQQPTAPKT